MAKIKKRKAEKSDSPKMEMVQPFSNEFAGLAFLSILTFILFGKSMNHQFLNYDDVTYVINNLQIREFSWAGFVQIFKSPVLGMYNPLTFVIYAFEYSFWGLNPKYFHLVNLLLHILSTVTCYYFIKTLCNNKEIAFYTALLFAIHPMHVSVVTWVSQAKTSLFVFFYLLGLISYMSYIRDGKNKFRNYFYTLLGCFLAVLAKPSAVTFAPMLLLLDYYLNRKLTWNLIFEKIPFFTISILFGLLTIYTHNESGDPIFQANQGYSLIEKILLANYAICFYFEKFIAPFGLSLIYPYPPAGSPFPIHYYLTLPILPFLGYLIYSAASFSKDLIFGISFFLIAVSIVLRILPLGEFGMANNYSYLSYIGLFFILCKFAVMVRTNEIKLAPRVKKVIYAVLFSFLGLILVVTGKRVEAYHNSTTIMTDVIEKYPDYATAYSLRGLHRTEMGDVPGAISDFDQNIKLEPLAFNGYMNRGNLYANLKNYPMALKDFKQCYNLQPDNPYTAFNLGVIYFTTGDFKNSLKYLDRSLKLKPDFHESLYFKGQIFISQQDFTNGIANLEKSKQLGNKDAEELLMSLQIGVRQE